MYHSTITASHAALAADVAEANIKLPPLAISPILHPQHGLEMPESRTFWSATANAAYIVREDDVDMFGPTPNFAAKLVDCPDLVVHGRRGPIGSDAAAIAGRALWRAADDATIRDRPSEPAAWHIIGWLPLLNEAGWCELVLAFLDQYIVMGGMVADWAIHARRDEAGIWVKRPHFHAVLTSRFWKDGVRKGQPQPAWLTTVKRRNAIVDGWSVICERG